jgi:glycosyltransferase involved in cell wall biosynthesis
MSQSSPFISVIIPVYNSERTILRTLESVRKQSFQDFEIIIVDDGSSDDSVLKINSFVSSNPELEIKLIIKENGGVSTARNAALRIARGTWMALLDSDDEWLPHKLTKQIEIISSDLSIDFLGTNRNGEHRNRFIFKKFKHLTQLSSHLLLYKNFFVTPSVLFKRSILDTIGFFDENMRYGEDVNFYIRISNIFNCVLLNESLVITGAGKPHFGHSGLSSNLNKMSKGEIHNIKLGYKMGIVINVEYYFLLLYSNLKYFRRIILVKLSLNSIAK